MWTAKFEITIKAELNDLQSNALTSFGFRARHPNFDLNDIRHGFGLFQTGLPGHDRLKHERIR
jgi:hypothetical protein